jgi:hypothetical protein
VHPAVFVTVTSGGRVSLWNLAKSVTEPVDALNITTEGEEGTGGTAASTTRGTEGAGVGGAAGAARALNKVVWARDGQAVLCGDSLGTLHMLRLHPSAAQSSPQEESRFESAIVSRAADQAHVAEESNLASPPGNLATPKKQTTTGTLSEKGGSTGVSEAIFSLE